MLPENICFFSAQSVWSKLAVLFIAYFTPVSEMIHVMLIFLAVDTIAGIWASMKEGQPFESSKLRTTVMKFLWYTVAVMISWMMENTFSLGWTKLSSITAGFICFVELKSIFENITRITDEPLFKRILKMLKRKGSETISEIMDDQDPNDQNGKDHKS